MSNITNLNRDYLIKINVKEATIDVPKMAFWNTDQKTSNMFVQLVINMSTNELISNYVTVQNATDYKIKLNVIKPKTNQYKTIEATLLNEEKALFEIDLPDEFTDQVGDYSFEFEVSSKVDSNDESITTSNGTYKVNGSILTNLNEETSSSPDLPILKQLIEQVKSLQGGDLTGYQKKSDNSLETTSKEVVGAINEVNSQFKDIANFSLAKGTDGKLYIKKKDGTLIGDGIEFPTDADLSKITMSVSGQTLKLLNNGEQIATVDIPTSTVTDEQVTTAINQAIEDGKISGSGTRTDITNSDTFAIGSSSSGGDTPVIPETNYSITNTLTNCTSSNSNTSILKDSSYTATLTADEGYTLGSISVTMGGADVSSTVVSGNTINISKVTGNVVITCTAKEKFNYLNYKKADGYLVSTISAQYNKMNFTASSGQNVYSFPVQAKTYKIKFIGTSSSNTHYKIDANNLNTRNTNNLSVCNIEFPVIDGVPQGYDQNWRPTITEGTDIGELSSAVTNGDGTYTITLTVTFPIAGYWIFSTGSTDKLDLEEVE